MSYSDYTSTPEYSDFEPTPPTEEENNEEIRKIKLRQEYIKKYAEDNNMVLLKSDYWCMDSYYYHEKYKRMYKVSNNFSFTDKSLTPQFELCNDNHIMKLNGITY